MCMDHTNPRRMQPVFFDSGYLFFDSTYDLFVKKAIEESSDFHYTEEDIEDAHNAAMELERLAAEQEVTVDYYIEEFLT